MIDVTTVAIILLLCCFGPRVLAIILEMAAVDKNISGRRREEVEKVPIPRDCRKAMQVFLKASVPGDHLREVEVYLSVSSLQPGGYTGN